MSTRIDDLPGPLPQDIIGDLSIIRQQNQNSINSPILQGPSNNTYESTDEFSNDTYSDNNTTLNNYNINDNSNIKMNIKKRVRFRDQNSDSEYNDDSKSKDIFSSIKSTLTEENLLILFVLVLASRGEVDKYLKMIPYIGPSMESDYLLTGMKALLLLFLFILLKEYVLPKVRI
jgi:hypothetical protein